MDSKETSYRLGQLEADQEHAQKEGEELETRVRALEVAKTIQDLAIAKCTAIWGFIVIIVTAIGGFVSYNFVKVKLAIVAAFKAFYSN